MFSGQKKKKHHQIKSVTEYNKDESTHDTEKHMQYVQYSVYSKTSDSGPSEIGTVYNRPLYKGHSLRS